MTISTRLLTPIRTSVAQSESSERASAERETATGSLSPHSGSADSVSRNPSRGSSPPMSFAAAQNGPMSPQDIEAVILRHDVRSSDLGDGEGVWPEILRDAEGDLARMPLGARSRLIDVLRTSAQDIESSELRSYVDERLRKLGNAVAFAISQFVHGADAQIFTIPNVAARRSHSLPRSPHSGRSASPDDAAVAYLPAAVSSSNELNVENGYLFTARLRRLQTALGELEA